MTGFEEYHTYLDNQLFLDADFYHVVCKIKLEKIKSHL